MRTPIHPGAVLGDELEERGLSANKLAQAIHVPANRISGILNQKRGITADTALRLHKFFGVSAEFWMNLQERYELDLAAARLQASEEIKKIPTCDEFLATCAEAVRKEPAWAG
jgi:addiction module HigA family antidote